MKTYSVAVRTVTLATVLALLSTASRAGILEVNSADANPANVAGAGFPGISGTGIQVGVVEAGNGTPLLGAQQPFLPTGAAPNAILAIPSQNTANGQGAAIITNHSTEVSGVIVASGTPGGSADGIAPGASVQAAGLSSNNDAIVNAQVVTLGSYNTGAATANKPRAHIVNMSFGNSALPDGLSTLSEWIDWGALSVGGNPNTSPSPQDNLFVISAGNSGTDPTPANRRLGQPADSYNGVTVGSTGIRNGAGNLAYNQFASYTSQTLTADTRTLGGGGPAPITFGRLKTDIVAPGGDPGPNPLPAAAIGAFNAPPAAPINQFVTTAGQQWELAPTNTPYNNTTNPALYLIDGYNPATDAGTPLTNNYYAGVDNTAPFVPGNKTQNLPARPTNLTGNDTLAAVTLSGTSFAAPYVSGTAAMLEQYGADQTFSTDHRVIKALLLNGATKQAPGGAAPLTDVAGRPWGAALDPNNPANNKLQFMPGLGASAGQTYMKADPFGGGMTPIKIGLDPQLGTGQLDAIKSLQNYAAGQHGPGPVPNIGWDLNQIRGYSGNNNDSPPTLFSANSNASINDYIFTAGPGHFTATLVWDRILSINYLNNDATNSGTWVPGDTFNATNAAGTQTGTGGQILTDLDLELWQVNQLNTLSRVDFSTSDVDNVEHIFSDLSGGIYALQVRDRTVGGSDTYALAWAVPEPASLLLVALALPAVLLLKRRRSPRM